MDTTTGERNVSERKICPILHVVVVGFHHKKGCQVEYAFPPFQDGEAIDDTECPDEWKHLPSLALPDGSHNFEKDTIYFHMPSRESASRTVFGISCYRQINAESLINRSADITRGTVQKSVCIISTIPLYGLINAKLELITHAYFDERDFSKVSLLEETYNSLNASLNHELTKGQQAFLGLSVRDLVLHFKHKIVLLVKLVLLERKVLFLKSPVKDLCTTILSLLSLFPGMIEHGLERCNELETDKEIGFGFTLDFNSPCSDYDYYEKPFNSLMYAEFKNNLDACIPESESKDEENNLTNCGANDIFEPREPPFLFNHKKLPNNSLLSSNANDKNLSCSGISDDDRLLEELLLDCETKEKVDLTSSKLEFQRHDVDAISTEERDADSFKGSKSSLASKESNASFEGLNKIASIKGKVISALNYWSSRDKQNGVAAAGNMDRVSEGDDPVDAEELAAEADESNRVDNDVDLQLEAEMKASQLAEIINLDINKCGLPLEIFSKGMLCHPYLSLPFLDLLNDRCVRGFVAGATNVLFKQKRHLVDVIIDIDEDHIEILDPDLRKQLHLTTEDLRFADYLVKNVSEEHEDIFLDGTGWEGGDEWLRAQFKWYIICLLRTSMLQEGCQRYDAFNPLFLTAWQKTRNFDAWKNTPHLSVLEINPGHPFQGQLSMADMRLRISHTMQSSERGRKINQAVVSTGKAVAQTSKALGGAITQARSTVSSWLQVFTTAPAPQEE